MKKWEDIVKERLEGYESRLPEGSYAAFRARRDGVAASSSKRVSPWIWGLSAAVAAGLSFVLFLRFPETDGGMETGSQPDGSIVEMVAEPVFVGTDSTFVDVPYVSRLVAQVVKPKPAQPLVVQETAIQEPVVRSDIEDAPILPSAVDSSATTNEIADEPEPAVTSPFKPASVEDVPTVNLNIAPVAGGVFGAGALAALAASLTGTKDMMEPAQQADNQYSGSPSGLGTGISDAEVLKEKSHHFPLKTALTTRIPLADRLYLTTGLDYTRYSSRFTYQLAGEKKQVAQYLGIPVRLDWTFVSGKRMDVYVGGGLFGDVCIGASLGGEKIRRDAPSLSVMGAGGVQLNVSKRIGVYIEPALSWRIPFGSPVLETYRTVHPVSFTTAAGIRINLDK